MSWQAPADSQTAYYEQLPWHVREWWRRKRDRMFVDFRMRYSIKLANHRTIISTPVTLCAWFAITRLTSQQQFALAQLYPVDLVTGASETYFNGSVRI